jgi:hypothetical protein
MFAIPPQTQIRLDKILATADSRLLPLARVLQRAAFYLEDRPHLEGDFHPAPIYVFQAHAFLDDPKLFSKLLETAAPF